jgi:cell division initiation protein
LSGEITPNDILQREFSQSFRGSKPEEVKDFLKLVASEVEELLRSNMFLEDKVKQLDEVVDEYRQMESTLKNTLVSSQRIGQEIKEEAERKSNILIREAEIEAERIIQKSKQRKERLEEETFQLLNQHQRFRTEFVSLIESHGKMLKAQDSRVLLEFGLNENGDSSPEPEPEMEPANDEPAEVGEEEMKDLEILFPEEKE